MTKKTPLDLTTADLNQIATEAFAQAAERAQGTGAYPDKDWLFEEIHMVAQAWKGANGGIYSIRGMCLELLEKLMLPRLAAERERCASICDGWIATYGSGSIQYTPPTEYATDAVQDIADAIRSGVNPKSQAKEPEASGGTARCASPEVRVGVSGAGLTATSEHMDVTAGETAPNSGCRIPAASEGMDRVDYIYEVERLQFLANNKNAALNEAMAEVGRLRAQVEEASAIIDGLLGLEKGSGQRGLEFLERRAASSLTSTVREAGS